MNGSCNGCSAISPSLNVWKTEFLKLNLSLRE
ncbi:hypothetical protein BN2476_1520010 [Paraburkholderia piptadeniae]|uniref:Uncharacterized protein n=1 Tax=Paraburkholderia piptadeniae TaxID=1701573 RepID=A0A1N7SY75_9BURK|nr:hypothetical protein BN2476_1520010 [Paraburkholderia piptadeniae]